MVWNVRQLHGDVIQYFTFADEREARDALNASRVSGVLFDRDDNPVQFLSYDKLDMVILLHADSKQSGPLLDRVAASEKLHSGDAPLIPPPRSAFRQLLMKQVMEAIFCRRALRFFSASPLRDTSLCFFDVERFPNVSGHVAISLDDAPCRFGRANSKLLEVLQLLKDFDAHATFMCIGKFLLGHEEDLVQLLREGHELANHGMVDRAYHEDEPADFEAAIDACNEQLLALQKSAGCDEIVKWFRCPHGKYTPTMDAILKKKQLTNVMCDTYASCPILEDGSWIGDFLSRSARPGSIILLHMPERGFREYCLVALSTLLHGLRTRGLRAVSVGELERLAASTTTTNAFDYDALQRICKSPHLGETSPWCASGTRRESFLELGT